MKEKNLFSVIAVTLVAMALIGTAAIGAGGIVQPVDLSTETLEIGNYHLPLKRPLDEQEVVAHGLTEDLARNPVGLIFLLRPA